MVSCPEGCGQWLGSVWLVPVVVSAKRGAVRKLVSEVISERLSWFWISSVGGECGTVRIDVLDAAVVVANDGRHAEDSDRRPVGWFYKRSKVIWGRKDFVGKVVHGWIGRVVRGGV